MQAALQGPSGRMSLETPIFTIGRASDNQLVVSDAKASSHHAVLQLNAQGHSLIDLGSTNGTFVNEQRLEHNVPRFVNPGDRIRIGDTTYTYEQSGAQAGSGFDPTILAQKNDDHLPTVAANPYEYTAYGYGAQPENTPSPYPSYTPQPAQPSYNPPPPAASPYNPQQPWGAGSASGAAPSSPSYPGQQPFAQPWGAGSGSASTPSSPSYPGQQPFAQPWGAGSESASTPSSPTYPAQQSWAASGSAPAAPPYGQPSYVPPLPSTSAPQKSGGGLKILLIVLAVIVVLGAGGGGYAFYLATRPQPVISVTSNYKVGVTSAGSTSTTLQASGHKFSNNSAITFLLDGAPVPGNQPAHSDANGNVTTTLTITTDWAVGNHTLTAKDASDYATKIGVPVAIVPQGQAHTPGPNGAPPDDTSGTLNVTLHINGVAQPQTGTLTITGKPDPAGGTVCQSSDDGQPHVTTGTLNGVNYSETASWSCTGTYKAGKLTYTRTATSDKIDLANGLSCTAHTPYVSAHLDGTFTNANTISGNYSDDAGTLDCNNGVGTQHFNGRTGTWTGQM